MVRCKCIQVRSVSTCGCYWSSIEALFHKAERCRQNFIGQAAVLQDRVKYVFDTTDYAFPNTSMVGSTRWIKLPLNSFLQECVVEDLLVPIVDVVHEFFFSGYKVCAVVRRAQNLSIPITQLLVSMIGTTSKWTARVVRQVKREPRLFSVDRLTDTKKGPK